MHSQLINLTKQKSKYTWQCQGAKKKKKKRFLSIDMTHLKSDATVSLKACTRLASEYTWEARWKASLSLINNTLNHNWTKESLRDDWTTWNATKEGGGGISIYIYIYRERERERERGKKEYISNWRKSHMIYSFQFLFCDISGEIAKWIKSQK